MARKTEYVLMEKRMTADHAMRKIRPGIDTARIRQL